MKSIKAAWGTGEGAQRINEKIGEIDFFIENDLKKCDKDFLGKKVYYSKDVRNWKDIYIYIFPKFYNEISQQLKLLGLKEGIDFIKFEDRDEISIDDIEEENLNFAKMVEEKKSELKESVMVFSSHLKTRNREAYTEWFNLLISNMKEEQFVFFSKYMAESDNEMQCPLLCLPKYWYLDQYPRGHEKIELANEIYCFFKDNMEMADTAKCIRYCYSEMQENYEYYYVYSVYTTFSQMLETLNPKVIILWAVLQHTHNILRYICRNMQIEVYAIHEGMIYGTFYIDPLGEHGESVPVCLDGFPNLKISKDDLKFTKYVLDELNKWGKNRHYQSEEQNTEKLKLIKKGRPIVTFLGDDDFKLCLVPSNERAKKNFSPIFGSGLEEIDYLAKLAKRNDWNIIYKPHPGIHTYKADGLSQEIRDKVIFIDYMNINELIDMSDVIVNNISSCGYVSMLRNKPVVETGRTSYNGYGCVYEVHDLNEVENKIKSAIQNGFTVSMKNAFLHHMALLLKYYLYKGGIGDEFFYGKDFPKSIEELNCFESKT